MIRWYGVNVDPLIASDNGVTIKSCFGLFPPDDSTLMELLLLFLVEVGETLINGVNASGAPLLTVKFELFSAVGLLHIGDVFTLMFRVVVILLLKEFGFGGLPLFFFAEGVVLIDDVGDDDDGNDMGNASENTTLLLLLNRGSIAVKWAIYQNFLNLLPSFKVTFYILYRTNSLNYSYYTICK